MVTQKAQEIKRKFFIGDRIDMDPTICNVSDGFRRAVFRSIMSGTNAQAVEILRDVGLPGFVPGMGAVCIPHNEAANFYGFRPEYLNSLLSNGHVSRRGYPNDMKLMTTDDFPLDVLGHGHRNDNHIEFFYDENMVKSLDALYHFRRDMVSIPNGQFFMYSPRLVLGICLLVPPSRVTDLPVVCHLIRGLKTSPYRFVPPGRNDTDSDFQTSEFKDVLPVSMPPIRQQESAGIPVMQDGSMVLSPDLFTHMIKTAVKEAVSEVVVQLDIPMKKPMVHDSSAPALSKRGKNVLTSSRGAPGRPNYKLAKPSNWESVVSQWLAGDISQKRAAQLTGMCVASFSKYAHGAKKF